MAAPLLKRKRCVGVKVETVPGTAETLAAADCTIPAYDAVAQPKITITRRPKNNTLSQKTGTAGARIGTVVFKTDVFGVAASKLIDLFCGCGMLNTAGTVTPVSIPPEGAGGAKTLTVGVFANGKRKQIHGAVGTVKLVCEAGEPASLEWEFTGVWDTVADVALPAPTFVTTAPLRFAGGFTVGAANIKCSKLEVDFANTVVMRLDPSSTGGSFGAHMGQITDREPKLTLDAEAGLVATRDVYGLLLAGTTAAVVVTLGTVGNQVTFTFPACQENDVQEGDREKLETDDLELIACANSDAGDDEYSIVFA